MSNDSGNHYSNFVKRTKAIKSKNLFEFTTQRNERTDDKQADIQGEVVKIREGAYMRQSRISPDGSKPLAGETEEHESNDTNTDKK